ncbi:MAG: MFS transporter [Candidatus Aenigmarchaeota archaeon]|nr:MFS transporter [Candidatus Aenigmarchaeota archaeon]
MNPTPPKKYNKKVEDTTEKSLDSSIKEGLFGTTSSHLVWDYISPYAISLGATNKEIGLLGVLQSLGSALGQIPGARLVSMMSRKAIWTMSYTLSRLLWIPILLIAIIPIYQVLLLMIIVFTICFLNGIRNPAWSSLMGDIVPPNRRGEYFGKRNMITGIAGLLTTVASGIMLVVFGFGILFFLSIIIGLFAVYFFLKIYEPPVKSEFHYKHSFSFSIKDIAFSMKMHSNFVWFTIYMCIVSFAIAISSPFYTVYMIKNLDIGYIWYAVLITINALIAILSQPYWGKFSDKYGDRVILIITSIMICFIPLFWMFATTVEHLILIHIFDGFMFGGWTLVTFNFLLSSTPENKRAGYIANHTLFAGLATVSGTLLASILIEYFEISLMMGVAALTTIFFLSFIVRLVSLAFLPKIQKDYTKPETEPLLRLTWKLTVVHPAKAMYRFVGYVYDVKWLVEKLKEIPSKTYTFFVYKIRLYRSDKI